jgi:RND family efflux transporter MFP subunit
MKKNWKWLLAVLLVTVVVIGAWRAITARRAVQVAQAQQAAQRAEPTVELAQADVVRAEQRELQRGLPISGSLRAVDSAFVKARVSGELQGLALREGDPVQAGQVVARVDPVEYRARMQQAQQQADAARAQIDIAERQFNNNKALVDQSFISRSALDTSQNNLAAAQSTHKAALAAVDMARKAMDDTVLRAPISGIVAQRLAQPGERIALDARVIEIVDLSRLEMEAALSPGDSVNVRVGQSARLQVEGSPHPVAARVARINPSAQAGSRSVLAYLSIADTAGLRQGLFAQGTVATGGVSAVAVPLTALRTDKPAPYVQVVQDNRIAHKPVEPGARGEAEKETWVGLSGLSAGAMVVRGHVGPLREGTLVKFTSAPTPALPQRGRESP